MTRAVSRVLAIPASSRINTADPLPKPPPSASRSSARRVSVHACAMPACSVSSRTPRPVGAVPEHTEAPGRVGLGEQARRERLARPGQRLDALHAVTACGQATDHGRLLGRRRERRAREHRVDQRAIEHAGAFAAAGLRAVHDRLLVGEQVARGEPPLTGVWGAVHVGAREELRGGALDRLGRCSLAVGGRPCHHRLACVRTCSASRSTPPRRPARRSPARDQGPRARAPARAVSVSSSRAPRPCSAARARTTSRHGAVSTP